MRANAITLLLVIAGAAVSAPSYAATSWQGQYIITNVTQPCITAQSDVAGDHGTIVFRPIINSGDPPEAVSIIGGHSASIYNSAAAGGFLNGNHKYVGERIDSAAFLDQFNGTSDLNIYPRNPNTNTAVIQISGTIDKWFNHSGCTVTLNAYLQPH